MADHSHRLRPLRGRDPDADHRAATPLELFYDLTYVVAFGLAADELAGLAAEGHLTSGLIGFALAVFGVSWAWINYSWFASAYDTDDWVCRLAVMVQMVGIVVFALGLGPMFTSIEAGSSLDIRGMVAGYAVVRLAMIFLWERAARDDPEHASIAHVYSATLGVAQIGFVAIALAKPTVGLGLTLLAAVVALEMSGPWNAQRLGGTPWHAGHITERYGLFVIVTLGEGIIGTVAAVEVLVHGEQGWGFATGLFAFAGVALTFGAWWMYFVSPWAKLLELRRDRALRWAYGHLLIFGSLAAVGAGLHVGAFYLAGTSELGLTATVLSTVIPFAVFFATFYGLFAWVVGELDRFHLLLAALTVAVLAASVALAAAGASLAVCLLVLAVAPVVTVLGFETIGHQHVDDMLDRLEPSRELRLRRQVVHESATPAVGDECPRPRSSRMSDHVYKSIEVTGSSTDSIQDAVRVAVDKAAESVENLEWFEVTDIRGHISEQKVAHFQVTTKLGFRLE